MLQRNGRSRRSAWRRAPPSQKAVRTTPPATTRRMHKSGATEAREPRQEAAPPRACALALEFFAIRSLHRRVVERQLGINPLEIGVLGLQLLDPSKLGGLQASLLALPLVVGRRTDADLATDVFDQYAGVGLLERRDDLRLG